MDSPANDAGPLVIRFRPFAVFAAYVGAVAFGVLTIGHVWLIVSGETGSVAVAVLLALAIPLAGFASVMLLAAAIHRSRNPYLVVDLEAGKIVRANRRRTYRLGPGERFAIEYGEAGSGESFMSGDRIVVICPDRRRSPTDLWGEHAHRGDWATLARVLWYG
jgi:hypothetical protein